MEKNADHEFERFPVEKKQIRREEPPELIFFDVDEYSEEADFIRVDDLFRQEAALTGWLSFTFIPKRRDDLISSQMSGAIKRCLLLNAVRIEREIEKIRIRPQFVQFRIELQDSDSAEETAREFRDDLEAFVYTYRKDQNNARFWSANCFVSTADRDFSDETILQLIRNAE